MLCWFIFGSYGTLNIYQALFGSVHGDGGREPLILRMAVKRRCDVIAQRAVAEVNSKQLESTWSILHLETIKGSGGKGIPDGSLATSPCFITHLPTSDESGQALGKDGHGKY